VNGWLVGWLVGQSVSQSAVSTAGGGGVRCITRGGRGPRDLKETKESKQVLEVRKVRGNFLTWRVGVVEVVFISYAGEKVYSSLFYSSTVLAVSADF